MIFTGTHLLEFKQLQLSKEERPLFMLQVKKTLGLPTKPKKIPGQKINSKKIPCQLISEPTTNLQTVF